MTRSDQMMRRQKVLADFGEFALGSDDLDAVLTEACRLVAEALCTQRAKVLEIQEDRANLLMRAGIGWEPGTVGRLRLTLRENSSEAYSIREAKPVISNDILTEDRFSFPDFMKREGVRALANVPIFVPGGHPYGLLQVDATEPRDFTQEDTEFLRTYAIILGPVIDRLHKTARLRESEEREREREIRFRTIFETAPVGLSVVTRDGRFRRVNRELARMLGRPERELISLGVAEVTERADVEASANALEESLRTGHTVSLDKRYRRPNGDLVYANSSLTPLPLNDGSTAFLVVTVDLTARVQAERELHDSEERLRLALNAGSLATWDWNLLTEDIVWSEEHFRMEGFDVDEVKPSYQVWSERVHPEDRAATEAALAVARDERFPYQREFRIRHPDGQVRWISADGRFFYDESGRAVRMIGVQRDVTVQREWRDMQAVMVAELQHRTRNLIGVVRSLADKTAAGTQSLREFLPRYRERLGSLARINSLLSKLDKGERVTFEDMLRAELGARGVLDGDAGARVVLKGPSGVRLRSATVQTFALAIHELTTNAVKYGALAHDEGLLHVRWSVFDDGAGQKRMYVEWCETGVPNMPAPDASPQGGGYGRELIERALPYQLKANTTFEIGRDGVRCTIDLPLEP